MHLCHRYDSIQAARVIPKQQEKIDRKSRYIAQLKDQADQRKREEVCGSVVVLVCFFCVSSREGTDLGASSVKSKQLKEPLEGSKDTISSSFCLDPFFSLSTGCEV